MNDYEIELMWKELTDVPFDEAENEMVLAEDWKQFSKGTSRDEIWEWFDKHHSKGVYHLLFELEA